MTTTMENPPAENTRTPETIAAQVEGLLFVADQPVSVAEMASTLEVSAAKIERALDRLAEI